MGKELIKRLAKGEKQIENGENVDLEVEVKVIADYAEVTETSMVISLA